MCAHISWWGKNKQTNISKNKDGITGHESKRLMSCQEKLHSSVKYIGKCLIAVKSTMKRSDECVFLQQRKIILSEKSSLLKKKKKITLCVLWFASWGKGRRRRFVRGILEKFLNGFFTKLSISLQIQEETRLLKIASSYTLSSVMPLNVGLWKLVLKAGQQKLLESYAFPDKNSYQVL